MENSVTEKVEIISGEYDHIMGWGVDADSENDPTYPMKKYTGDDHRRLNYQRPPLQEKNIEVLRSNERPTITAVFGTSTPPKGLSGMLRRYAFRFSEGNWGHWLALMLADRINVAEGFLGDLSRGRLPNPIAERGLKSEWKHNRPRFVRKIVTGVIVVSALTATIIALRKRRTTLL